MNTSPRRRWAHPITLAALLIMVGGALALVTPSSASAHTDGRSVTLNNTTTQTDRIFRDGTASSCAAPKLYPGPFGSATTYNYNVQTYVAVATGCLTVTRLSSDCNDATTDSTNAHLVIYAGAYNPAAQATNYLGDQGSSNNANVMSVNVTQGQSYSLVTENTNTQSNCTVTLSLTQVPDTKIASGPSGPVGTPTFTFTGSDAGTYQCSIDGGAFAACTSPKAISGLSVGGHTLAVKAIDTDTLVDATPATASFTRCDRPRAEKLLKSGKKKLKVAKAALKVAKKSGNVVAIAKAKNRLKKAQKKLKKAKAGLKACPA